MKDIFPNLTTMANTTTIFIPDITGFTSFVNQTEIEHSQHIISELLEVIIDSENLGFSISEIEGDAILFYKSDKTPSFEEMLEQTKMMFINFHVYLNEIEQLRVCQCGACTTATKLSLKFIIHLGNVKEVKIKQFNKLIGSDLILAHRLLKNNIGFKEYLLVTDSYINTSPIEPTLPDKWIKVVSEQERIEELGEISLKCIDFSPLMNEVPKRVMNNKLAEYNRKPDILVHIKAPMLLVHKILTDNELKQKYAPKLQKVISEEKINRINSSHICVFDDQEIHFVTKSNNVSNDKISYSEEAQLKKDFRIITDYRLKEKANGTELSIFIFKPKADKTHEPFYKQIKDYLLLKLVVFGSRKGINLFKNFCEQSLKK